jgi:probable rRNA maturation factor
MSQVDISGDLAKAPVGAEDIRSAALAALAVASVGKASVSIHLCGDPFIRDLNARWRGKDEPTDVLSFCQAEGMAFDAGKGTRCLGDVIVSVDSAKSNADRFGVPEREEFLRLVVHGVLHLCGFDHATNEGGEPMLALQERIVAELPPIPAAKTGSSR